MRERKRLIVGLFDEKALKNLGITMDGDAWTFKVMTCNPLPFTNENLKCLCQEVNEIYVE